MATEHTLKLRAVLDTTDIQSKLSQLKAQQRGGQGGREGLAGGGLQQTLQRLNMTLGSLQRSIERLAAGQGQGKMSVAASSPGLRAVPFALTAPARPRITRALPSLQRPSWMRQTGSVNASAISAIRETFSKLSKQEQEVLKFYTGSDDPAAIFDVMVAREQKKADLRATIAKYRADMKKYRADMAKYNSSKAGLTKQQKTMVRMGAGFAFGALGGGLQTYGEATGNEALATAGGAMSNIGMGTAMGFAAGGPIGAAIGGGIGLLNTAFEQLAKSAREASAALDQQHQRIFKGQDVDNAISDMLRGQEDRRAMERGDRSYFESQLSQERDLYKRAAGWMKTEVGFGGKGDARFKLREYEKNTEELMKFFGRKDPEVVRRQRVAALYTAQADVVQKSDARIQQLEQILKQLGPQGINEAKASSARSLVEQLREALSAMHAPDLSNVNSLASQGYMISEADDEARLEEANKHLADLVMIARQIKDAEEEAATYGS